MPGIRLRQLKMNISNLDKLNEKLNPCSFCGSKKVKLKKITHGYQISCLSKDCPSNPHIFAKDKDSIIKRWNDRGFIC